MLRPQNNTTRPPLGETASSNSNLVAEAQNVWSSIAGSASGDIYNPPTRRAIRNGKWVDYNGPGLVTENGTLLTKDSQGNLVTSGGTPFYYDIEADSRKFYAGMSPSMRIAVTEQLVAANFLSANNIGDYDAELYAMQKLMDYANTMGKEWKYALKERVLTGPARRGGVKVTYRTSNTEDLTRAVKQVAQQTIGREVSDEEAQMFAKEYQQQEVSYQRAAAGGGTVMSPMNLETAAAQFVEKAQPREAAGYKYLGYMNQLFDAIGVQ